MPFALLTLLQFALTSTAFANASLMLRVTTPKGESIPHAVIAFEEDGYTAHSVRRQSGDLTIHHFETRNGKKALEPNSDVRFTASAAGYYPSQQTITLSGNRTTMRVTLRKIDLDLMGEKAQFSLSPNHILGLSSNSESRLQNTLHATVWLIQQGEKYNREAMQWADIGVKLANQDESLRPADRSEAMRLATLASLKAWRSAAAVEKPSQSDTRLAENLKTVAFRAAKRWLDYNIETSQNFSEPRNLCITAAPKPPDCDDNF